MYCFHHTIRIYFISFIVQISPFVHLFTLKIVFHWAAKAPLKPHQGSVLDLLGALSGPQEPAPQVVPTFHFIPSYAPGKKFYIET